MFRYFHLCFFLTYKFCRGIQEGGTEVHRSTLEIYVLFMQLDTGCVWLSETIIKRMGFLSLWISMRNSQPYYQSILDGGFWILFIQHCLNIFWSQTIRFLSYAVSPCADHILYHLWVNNSVIIRETLILRFCSK